MARVLEQAIRDLEDEIRSVGREAEQAGADYEERRAAFESARRRVAEYGDRASRLKYDLAVARMRRDVELRIAMAEPDDEGGE